jgi:hypothetical protein
MEPVSLFPSEAQEEVSFLTKELCLINTPCFVMGQLSHQSEPTHLQFSASCPLPSSTSSIKG